MKPKRVGDSSIPTTSSSPGPFMQGPYDPTSPNTAYGMPSAPHQPMTSPTNQLNMPMGGNQNYYSPQPQPSEFFKKTFRNLNAKIKSILQITINLVKVSLDSRLQPHNKLPIILTSSPFQLIHSKCPLLPDKISLQCSSNQ